MRKGWVFSPHSGGKNIPPRVREAVKERLEKHAAKNYSGRYTHLEISFRGALCYLDAFIEPESPSRSLLKATGETKEEYLNRLRSVPVRLGRLRYFGDDRWSYAFYTYSNEKYEPTLFPTGDWFGAPEEAFDVGAAYLRV